MAKGQQLKHFYQSSAKNSERGDINELYLLPLKPISDKTQRSDISTFYHVDKTTHIKPLGFVSLFKYKNIGFTLLFKYSINGISQQSAKFT